ncbi:aspartate carbamoyltransferase [Metallosphaera hakonensis]|uniref:Aspartate carbamoyltransferase n=1 Tax=Metallosphaera hakonensis JCM 8857 = DSM 7519 TaxID=1293036 RepID=A0A2U9IUW1_9CREN|nr:aspartate carbamoyltransferase [Metallosphaera hakonensis]AWR99752.1 aspartate carbamoyltransferase [Metallosphaera hakonensis JCM 8857 = DSM 7519]
MRDVISVLDFSKEEILKLFDLTEKHLNNQFRPKLEGKIVATAFFEPSTRTALSFSSAALSIGAKVLGFSSDEATSVSKGENLADTIRMLDNYADCIVMRHKLDGSAKFAAEIASKPVINAGDGKREHPTQALIDMFTVMKLFGQLENLVFGFIGDLRYARTVNSMLRILTLFKPKMVYLISPQQLRARTEILEGLNYPFKEITDVRDVAGELDVLYVTRIQRERFLDEDEYEKVKESYKVDVKTVEAMRKDSAILHPLPRVSEVDRKIDSMPQAKYFLEASYAVPLRSVLLHEVMTGD